MPSSSGGAPRGAAEPKTAAPERAAPSDTGAKRVDPAEGGGRGGPTHAGGPAVADSGGVTIASRAPVWAPAATAH
eukprot:7929548-Pyramimonas_sp.AAC.1